ncbi:hypothetical protein H6F90_09775 [Trichocoleus sp. FACHB-591]|uniref:hypothetical protein n=1 Tax=Trichocoleus sp. FACHB-591 TaxID=2692872 RepID=UPI001688BA6F|nr:hypothetical protein [Trichocoleus sp. FACHB-591]MBD2095446.1 hypothetical protein [Trichocoleus sp. FACHB-591]
MSPVTDSPSSEQTSTSVLTKLLDVDADLASQEATLLVQLEAVREKRNSLKSVIGMFSSADTGSTPAAPAAPAAPAKQPGKPGRKPRASKAQDAKPAPVADEVAPEPSTPASPPEVEAETETPAPAKSGRGRRANPDKPKRGAKPARKLEGWQRYVRSEFGKTPLPEAVSVVLQRQPEDIIEVPAIVDAIFEQEMPQTVRNKARDRILHVLSAGVKENKWYRGRTGQYSLSRNAAASNKAS